VYQRREFIILVRLYSYSLSSISLHNRQTVGMKVPTGNKREGKVKTKTKWVS
jgi:hypothetical protein